MTRRKRTYDDKFRASAVVMLEAQGYPSKKGALTLVANHLKVPATTLRGWFTAQSNPPPTEIRNEKRGDLVAMIESELYGIFDEMNDKRQDATYRELATAAGILVDKKQLLSGEATGRTEINERIKFVDYGLGNDSDTES